jgi:hypothetical protein
MGTGIGITIANMVLNILTDYPEGIRCNEVYNMLAEKGYSYDSVRMAVHRHLKNNLVKIPLRDEYKIDGWLWKLKKGGVVVDKRFKHGNRSMFKLEYISLADKISKQLLKQVHDDTIHLCCGCVNFKYNGNYIYCEAEHLEGQAFDMALIRKEITSNVSIKGETIAFAKALIKVKACKDFRRKKNEIF